ncbi:MAG: hypothetical protein GX050_01885 [Firmicutes bacterium]|nr:hypothetical protein [Bacillota bacterium]
MALFSLLILQLLVLWLNSGLEPLLFGAHHSSALLFRLFFCLLVWLARFYFFPQCRDTRMLLLGFAGTFLFLVVFNHCLIMSKIPGLTYTLRLFDQGINAVYLGVVFEITAVIVWEVSSNPRPFGFALHSYAQRRKAGEEVLSSLMKLGFFYSALLILAFNRLSMYTHLSWELFSRVAGALLVGSLSFLLASFRYRLRSQVSPALDELERQLEYLLTRSAPSEGVRGDELFYLQNCRELLLNSPMLRWQPEDLMMVVGSLLLFVAQPAITQLVG